MTSYVTEQAVNCHVLRGAAGSVVLVYNYLRNAQALAEKHGRLWITPRVGKIAADIGRHTRTVQRALAELKRRGALVLQTRFRITVGGIRRQISNRIRLITTAVAAALARSSGDQRPSERQPHRGDRDATPSTQSLTPTAPKLWITTPLYRRLMEAGIKKSAPNGR